MKTKIKIITFLLILIGVGINSFSFGVKIQLDIENSYLSGNKLYLNKNLFSGFYLSGNNFYLNGNKISGLILNGKKYKENKIYSGENIKEILEFLDTNIFQFFNDKNDSILDEHGISIETLSGTSKSAIGIKSFREKQEEIISDIYEKSNFSILLNIESAKKQIKELSSDFSKIEEEFDDIKGKKKRVDGKYDQVKQSIVDVIKDIKSSQEEIYFRIDKINIYSSRIIDFKKNLFKLKKDIDKTKGYMINYTNLIYKINNDIYGKDLNVDDLKLFAKSSNIVDTLSNEDVVKLLALNLKTLINILEYKQGRYEFYLEELNNLRIKYKSEVEKYESQVESFNQQKKYLLDLLEYLKYDKKEIGNKFEFLLKDRINVKKQIVNLISVIKNDMEFVETSNSVKIGKLLNTDEREDSDKFLSWPVYPVSKISAFYNDKDYKKIFGIDHEAIDIPAQQGDEVYSAADGVVYKIYDHDGPQINWLIVLHKHGYVSVYLHMNKIFVKNGDFIKRGQIIGLVGGKPGTRGAGIFSTGPHVHFNVFKNGEKIDPLYYMDLSVLNDKDILQPQYRLKYLKDKISRNINLNDIEYMSGKFLNNRRQNFLNRFGSGPYSDLSLWESASEGMGIDVDLGICIGFSETGLGKNFAKNGVNNIGNVGNNDRGDRVGFLTPYQGVRSIYKTLNNKYLSKNMTIDQLSRFGNKNGSIYASSPYNWHKNIIRCMTKIKGYRVPEDYAFREYINQPEIELTYSEILNNEVLINKK